MKAMIRYCIFACLAFCLGTACTEDACMEGNSNGKSFLEVYATIGKAITVQTRAEGDETGSDANKDKSGLEMDEYYSYSATRFITGCQIGFYSANGTDGTYDKDRLKNVCLTYSTNSFVNEDIEISSITNLGKTFAYYPYSEVNNKGPVINGTTLEYPIDIYVSDDDSNDPYTGDNKNKVIDLLTAIYNGTFPNNGIINYTFTHACSMLLITRGTGFDEADQLRSFDSGVEVKLKNGLKMFVKLSNGTFSLATGIDDSAPVKFPANYYTYKKTVSSQEVDVKVHSVILPPSAEVEYIKMMDDFGTWQYIRPEQDMKLPGGYRYSVTVKLDGPLPTIYPHEITPWDDVPILIDTKSKGIYDLDGLKGWMHAYNTGGDLTDYGDGIQYGDKTQWIFHLYADIDCSGLEEEYQYFIETFKDRLEGHGHTLKNIRLTKANGSNIGLIGELNDGSINNLKIDGISISGGTDVNDYTGTIAGTITNGSITECKITGININSEKGYVGSLAGKVTAGEVDKCLLEGNLQLGKDAVMADGQKLFGEKDAAFSPGETNTSGVYVFQASVDNTGGN